jgi:phosphoribosylglycinamide formyltransferase 1
VGVTTRRRVAVLISGRGSNLQALIEASRRADYPAEIVLVVANRPDAGGLMLAKAAGIATKVIAHRDFAGRTQFDQAIDDALRAEAIEIVCLAGFMRILGAAFLERWNDRVINIHPSLLPAYPGLDTHARALTDGVRFTGCTVHVVRAEVDRGPIIAQAVVPVLPGDDEAALASRVLAAEHRVLPMALALVASGRAKIDAGRVVIDGVSWPDRVIVSPLP